MRSRHPRASRPGSIALGLTAIAATLAVVEPASADDSAYCRKVRARATSEASLLFAPSVQALGIKFPSNGVADSGVTTGLGYQLRAQVAFSPLDVYKATRVLRVGEADCREHEAVAAAQSFLAGGASFGRLAALRSQASFLDGQRAVWSGIVAAGEERLAAQVTPLLDVMELRARANELERRRARIQADIAQLEAAGAGGYRGSLDALVASVETRAMAKERELSHVRSLDAWGVTAAAGVVPRAALVDYYGVVQVSFNFGSFWRNAAETRYVDARQDELRTSRFEVADMVRRLRKQLRGLSLGLQQELATYDRHAAALSSARAAIVQSTAPNAPQTIAVLDLDTVAIDAERTYLKAFIAELSKLEENVDAK